MEQKKSKIIFGKLNLEIEFTYDTETEEFGIKSLNHSISNVSKDMIKQKYVETERIINQSEYGYKILTIGKGDISEYLIPGSEIKIVMNNKEFTGLVHSSVSGRVGKLGSLFKENKDVLKEGTKIKIIYNIRENFLELKVIE